MLDKNGNYGYIIGKNKRKVHLPFVLQFKKKSLRERTSLTWLRLKTFLKWSERYGQRIRKEDSKSYAKERAYSKAARGTCERDGSVDEPLHQRGARSVRGDAGEHRHRAPHHHGFPFGERKKIGFRLGRNHHAACAKCPQTEQRAKARNHKRLAGGLIVWKKKERV